MSLQFQAGSSGATASGYRRMAAVLLRLVGRLVDNWVADIIARRERDVMRSMLHGFSDRALRDIGISRGEIDFAILDKNGSLVGLTHRAQRR